MRYYLEHIVEPGVFIYYKSPSCFTSDFTQAYFFGSRDIADRVANAYPMLNLSIKEINYD